MFRALAIKLLPWETSLAFPVAPDRLPRLVAFRTGLGCGPTNFAQGDGLTVGMPILLQHAIDNMVDKMVIEPFRLSSTAFVDETQSVRDGLALEILGSHLNFDPIQLVVIE